MNINVICLQEVSSIPVIEKLQELMSNYKLYYPKKSLKNEKSLFLQFNVFLVKENIKVSTFHEINKKNIYLKVIDPIKHESINIYNIHLKSDYDKNSSEIRQKQIKELINSITTKNNILCGDFNSEIGSPELNLLDKNNFVNILISRKNDLPNLKTNTIWMDKNNNNQINSNELKMIDYFYTDYKLYNRVTNLFIKFIFYQKIHNNDILLKISDHYPIILFIS